MARGHYIILCDIKSDTVTSSYDDWEPNILSYFSDRLHVTVFLTTKLNKDEINVIKFLGCS